jgi:hypothetical protein
MASVSSKRILLALFVVCSKLHGIDTFLIPKVINENARNAYVNRQKTVFRLSKETTANKNGVLDRKLLSISFFSFLHQAAMPFAELVDSAYLSNMDSTTLGAMGVARSSQVRDCFDPICATHSDLPLETDNVPELGLQTGPVAAF